MKQNSEGRWDLSSYELIPVSENIQPDMKTQNRIDELMDTVDTNYLADFGYNMKNQILDKLLRIHLRMQQIQSM